MNQNQVSNESHVNAEVGASDNKQSDRRVKDNYNIVTVRDRPSAALKRAHDSHLPKAPSKNYPNVLLEIPIETISSRNTNAVDSNEVTESVNLNAIKQLSQKVTYPKSLAQICWTIIYTVCWSNSKLVREREDLVVQCSNLKDEVLERDLQLNNLKQALFQEEQRSAGFQLKLIESERENKANSEAFAMVKRDYEQEMEQNSQQISELNETNRKLETRKAKYKHQTRTLKTELENAKEDNKKLSAKNEKPQKNANPLQNKNNQYWKKDFIGPVDDPYLTVGAAGHQTTYRFLMEPPSSDGQGSSKAKNEKSSSGPTPPKKKKPNNPK